MLSSRKQVEVLGFDLEHATICIPVLADGPCDAHTRAPMFQSVRNDKWRTGRSAGLGKNYETSI